MGKDNVTGIFSAGTLFKEKCVWDPVLRLEQYQIQRNYLTLYRNF